MSDIIPIKFVEIPPLAPARPYPTVTPFTDRDGDTYTRVQELIVSRMNVIIGEVNAFGVQLKDDVRAEIEDMRDKVQAALDEFAEGNTASINSLIEYVDEAVQSILNASIEVNDTIVSQLINDPDSGPLTRAALDNLLTPLRDGLADLESDMNDRFQVVNNNLGVVSARVTNIEGELPSFLRSGEDGVHNVKRYGAVGNGIADDTAAVQAAVNAANGGIVFFPEGEYRIVGTVTLVSGTEITGPRATITKRNLGSGDSSLVFAAPYYSTPIRNITIHDINFRGHFPSRGIAVYWGHKDHGLHVYNISVYEAVSNGHCFDLQGSRHVKIHNSAFYGAEIVAGREFAEAIQIDVSARVGMPTTQYEQVFDGSPCFDISVTDCEFRGHLGRRAPRAFGSHAQVEGRVAKHIEFARNYIEAPNSSSIFVSAINFMGCDYIRVVDNEFDFDGAAAGIPNTVGVYRAANAIPLAQISNPTPSTNGVGNIPEVINVSGNRYADGASRTNGNMRPVYENGFTAYASGLNLIEVRDGNVYLSGPGFAPPSKAAVTGFGTIAFVLPPSLCPITNLVFDVAASGGHARVKIYSNGNVVVGDYDGTIEPGFVGCCVSWAQR